jgi:hypothetical protein
MTLLRAAELGIDRFAHDADTENWSVAGPDELQVCIAAVYKQVLGQQHLMQSERLHGAESLFRNGYLSVREFVRAVALSGLYRSKFFEHCNAYRFIELNHKHLTGRAPHNREEMLHHFTILQEQGYEAEINSYLDSAEYQGRFGENTVPYLHGWGYSNGHEGRQFSWLMQLARGAGASVKGPGSGQQSTLNRFLHQNRAVAVPGALPAVSVGYAPANLNEHYRYIATDGPFRAQVSDQSGFYPGDVITGGARHTPAQDHRVSAPLGASGYRGDQARSVTITISGVTTQSYVRSGDYVMRAPLTRFNQALRRANRLGVITQVCVH